MLKFRIRGARFGVVKIESATLEDLQKAIAQQFALQRNRQKLTIDNTVLNKDNTIALLKDEAIVYIKDLGPQVGWQTVFLVEYAWPLIIHPLVYTIQVLRGQHMSRTQTLLCALIVLHFVKRELETLFVHRFSHATMPLFNLFKNSAHYGFLSGVAPAYTLYVHPTNLLPISDPKIAHALAMICTLLFLYFEYQNLRMHVKLRMLRPSGSSKRGVPRGDLFKYVACANYTYEALSWAMLCILSGGDMALVVFTLVSSLQMGVWAKKKWSMYRKEVKGYNVKWAMLPGLW